MLLIFYKGPEITTLRRLSHPRLVHSTKGYRSHPPSAGHQVLGSLLGTISCFSCATWFVIQVMIQCRLSFLHVTFLFFWTERWCSLACPSMSSRGKNRDVFLVSNVHPPNLCLQCGLCFIRMPDCERRQIPLFFMNGGVSYIVLCSVLGSVLIVAGLYLVLWGQSEGRARWRSGKGISSCCWHRRKGSKMTRLFRIERFMKMKQNDRLCRIGLFILLYTTGRVQGKKDRFRVVVWQPETYTGGTMWWETHSKFGIDVT
jgi:hypothetical protein